MKVHSGWRARVLHRLHELHDILEAPIPPSTLSKMSEVSESLDFPSISSPPSYLPISAPKTPAPTTQLFSSQHSFFQQCSTHSIPYHFQIVVPNATGTASATAPQLYEIAVWQRCILQCFTQSSVNVNFFEFSSTESPLIIDVFAVPSLDTLPLYWKSAFEELPSDSQLFPLKSRSLKGVFPPQTPYISVTFHDGKGFGKIWEGGIEPRKMAIDVVEGLWRESEEEAPENLTEMLQNFTGWPQ